MFPTQYSVDIDGYVLVYSIDSEQSFDVVQVKIIIIVIFISLVGINLILRFCKIGID